MDEFYIDVDRQGAYLYQKNGDFRNHNAVDLLVAEIHDEKLGKVICKLLNEKYD